MRGKLVMLMALTGLLVAAIDVAPVDAAKPKKLSETKVRKYLAPVVKDIGEGLAQDLKSEDPTVTLVDSRVGNCERKNRRRIDCDLNFTFRQQPDPDLTCSLRVGVKYKSKRSKKLVMALLSDKPKCFTLG
jgi:hypothetical protein